VGAEKFKIDLNYRNLVEFGDQITVSYSPTITGGSQVFDIIYNLPINPTHGTIELRASPSWSQVTQAPFDALNIRAERQQYSLTYRQPIIRNTREELGLSLGLNYQQGQTFIFNQFPTPFGFGADDNGMSRSTVIQLRKDYVSRDYTGAWALQSQFNIGTGFFNATTNNEPIPDGHFFSWNGNIGRYQKLGDNHVLLIQGAIQLTPDSLLPAHQFVVGGGQSVRGYRQNARTGDNGIRFSIEDQITLSRNEKGDPLFLIAPFVDIGGVWNNFGNPNRLPNQTLLVGAGLGLQWNQFLGFNNLGLRIDYGFPFINLNDRGNNLQDNGFYFRLFNSY
jgi:hemolysin activation/secretion protein